MDKTERFIEKMKLVNSNIKILGEYINSTTPIEFICECGETHARTPNTLLAGHRCSKFSGTNNPKKQTYADFIRRLSDVDPQVKVVGEYIDMSKKVEFECVCGNHGWKEPAQMLRGYTKCKSCANNRMTFKQFKSKVQEINKNIVITDTRYDDNDYIRKDYTVSFVCECGAHERSRFSSLLIGNKCWSCSHPPPPRKTHDQFVYEMRCVNPKIDILENYSRCDAKILYRCECGNVTYSTPHSLLAGIRCSSCMGNKKKTTEEFINEMKLVNKDIVILGKYINAETKIEYRCSCGNIHASTPSLLLMGGRCGHCNMSFAELKTAQYLDGRAISYNYEHKFGDCKYKTKLKFDFYVPQYNAVIELDGEHHFKPVAFRGINQELAMQRHLYTVKLDQIKNRYCKKSGINLIRIPYWDFNRIDAILDEKEFLNE